jgi:serine/threonine protein kinase
VNFYGACTAEPNLAIVMELMEGGSLYDLLHAKSVELPWNVRLGIVEEIAMGIKVLHANKPMVCRDVIFFLIFLS